MGSVIVVKGGLGVEVLVGVWDGVNGRAGRCLAWGRWWSW